MRILSGTLSWLDEPTSPLDAAKTFLQRVVTYPYLRVKSFALDLVQDALDVFKAGKLTVCKCLLGIHRILEKSDSYYLLNRLYVTDLCIWFQQISPEYFDAYVQEVESQLEQFCQRPSCRLDLTEIEASYEIINS